MFGSYSTGRALHNLCKKSNATCYLSGPSAKNYIDTTAFEDNKIDLQYMSYDGYKEYPQLYQTFEHQVSIIDLLLNVGQNVQQYLLSSQCEMA